MSIPLHLYKSPNGNGLCSFEANGQVCGGQRIAFIHMLPPAEPTTVTDHPFLTELGIPADIGCRWATGQGTHCGASFDRHATAYAPDPVQKYLEEKGSAAYETYHGASFPVDDPPTTAQTVAMFHDQALRLAVIKNRAYGDAWRKQGYVGNLARVLSKAERLRSLLWQDKVWVGTGGDESQQDEETVRDTLLDLANLCAMMAANVAAGNRWGDQRG